MNKRSLTAALAFAAMTVAAAWAGALVLQVTSPETNAEAKSMNAVALITATACHEPEKSMVSASYVQAERGELRRTELKVIPLRTAGTFAVLGSVPRGSVIDVALTNPEYQYRPRVLVHTDSNGVQWASVRRFFSTPPTDSDMRSILGAVD